uniref:GATA zinc finger domain-containing protein 4-like n=1 Tax=Diabrotica virgifera virgifera TaxID=50390 RepID=A0A6P7GY43_DIAVI
MHIKIGENQHSPPMTSSKRHSHSLYNNGSNSQPNSYAGNHSSLISSNSSYLDNTAHVQNGNNSSSHLDSNSNLQTRSLDIQPVQENSGITNFQGPSRNFTENNPTANNHSANYSVQSVKNSHILLGTAKVTLLIFSSR